MTTYNRRKEELISKLKNKEYRDAFVEESINIGIPFQIKTLREQREWTQKDLGNYSKMEQARISLLEDINYQKFTLSTLKRLASAFDIALIVRFTPFSDLVNWELNLSSESLKALSFDDEPYFKDVEATSDHTTIHPSDTSNKVVNIRDFFPSRTNESSTSRNTMTAGSV